MLDFHSHYYPPEYLDAVTRGPAKVRITHDAEGNPCLHYPGDYNVAVRGHRDLAYREEVLAREGVDRQLITFTTPGVHIEEGGQSVRLARTVQRTLVGHLGRRYEDVADLGVKQGPFYVLVGAHMPCVLVEVSFLTHPVEGRRLADAAYQAAVAEGLYAGVAAYLADARRGRTH